MSPHLSVASSISAAVARWVLANAQAIMDTSTKRAPVRNAAMAGSTCENL